MTDAFDAQPELADDRVRLRPLKADDWDALFAVASDPLIWEVHPAHDRWQEPVFRRFFDDALASGGALAAIDPATGEIIGSSRFDVRRAGEGEIEIGWTFVARAYWGGAVNRSMKRLMIAHALQHFDRVIFLVGETNGRSRRAMEKIGGVLTPRLDHAEMAGVPVTHVVYAIDREGFERGPLS
ncbi:GNAT family N-acetyltransferase [Sphingomonas tabacisoli]|uniref:GNAT family N-acetyltransferase n=1 Tax=Sphingomonas tabacisoli TaxID=2249466 RepID=A0ABW4I7C8_9SPHN